MKYVELHMLRFLQKNLQIERNDLDNRLKVINIRIRQVERMNADDMTFGHVVEAKATESPVLSESIHWKRIGQTLYSLALLVGADVPGSERGVSKTSVVTALQRAAQHGGRAITVILARLEAQNITIREQEQAITALQFRHLLEMIPDGGKAPPQGQATSRWKDFWRQAVTEAFSEFSAQSPQLKSPLHELLHDQFNRASKRKDKHQNPLSQRAQLDWLINETDISNHGQALYGTLSEVIHKYTSAEFSVSPTYSPGDLRILQSIRPDKNNVVDGAVDWDAEKKRYV